MREVFGLRDPISYFGGNGMHMSDAKVELFDVALKGCKRHALFIPPYSSETTVVVATKPSVFLLGVQKCGTTSLSYSLKKHFDKLVWPKSDHNQADYFWFF